MVGEAAKPNIRSAQWHPVAGTMAVGTFPAPGRGLAPVLNQRHGPGGRGAHRRGVRVLGGLLLVDVADLVAPGRTTS